MLKGNYLFPDASSASGKTQIPNLGKMLGFVVNYLKLGQYQCTIN